MQKRLSANCMQIINGDGWRTREIIGRPKARFFGFLSVIWLGVSVIASFPFWGFWGNAPLLSSWVEVLCGVLLIPQPVFIILAIMFWFFEKPRKFTIIEFFKMHRI